MSKPETQAKPEATASKPQAAKPAESPAPPPAPAEAPAAEAAAPGPIVTPDTSKLWQALKRAEHRRNRLKAELDLAERDLADAKKAVAEYVQ